MNLLRYKVKLTSPGTGESKNEFVGTWIGFAGMLCFFAHASIEDFMDDVFLSTAIVIGVLYCLYWFSTQHRAFFWILSIVSICALVLLASSAYYGLEGCEKIEAERGQLSCLKYKYYIPIIYATYTFTVFCSTLFYILRSFRKAV